jgi:hypothetical protein
VLELRDSEPSRDRKDGPVRELEGCRNAGGAELGVPLPVSPLANNATGRAMGEGGSGMAVNKRTKFRTKIGIKNTNEGKHKISRRE